MAKVKNPLYSITARGRFGAGLVYSSTGKTAYVTSRVRSPASRSKGRNDVKAYISTAIKFWNLTCARRLGIANGTQCLPLFLTLNDPTDEGGYQFFLSFAFNFNRSTSQIYGDIVGHNFFEPLFNPEAFYRQWLPFFYPLEPPFNNYELAGAFLMGLLEWLIRVEYIPLLPVEGVGIDPYGYFTSSQCRFLGDGRGRTIFLGDDNYLIAPIGREQIF